MLHIRNKAVRITLRLLLCFLGFILLLFAAISIYVETNKKQLLNSLRKKASENLRSEITYRDADITIWRNFPFIGIRLYDINITDSAYKMSFFKMKEMAAEVSLLQYFRKNIELRNVLLKDGLLHMFTDTSGYTNKYLLHFRKESTKASGKELILNHASLKNVQVILENRQRNKLFDFLFKETNAAISKKDEDYDISLDNHAIINNMAFDLSKGSYLKGQSVKMNIDLHIDKAKASLSFEEQKFIVNDQSYLMKGEFIMKGAGFFTLAIRTSKAPYEKIRGIFSENIAAKLRKFNIEKPIDAEAILKGPLAYKTIPKILASWKVNNNVLTTEVARFTNCSFTGSFTNERITGAGFTDPNSQIILNNFTGNWEGIQLAGKHISVSNLIDPYINFTLASSTDFTTLNNKLGLSTISFHEGKAALNLSYAGPLVKDISILDKLNGQLSFSNGTIKYLPRNFTFSNCSGNVFFSSNNIRVDDLKCNLGKTQFIINVAGNNMSGLTSHDPTKTTIACNVYCPVLNIEELSGLFSRKRSVSIHRSSTTRLFHTAASVDNLMDNGNLSVSLRAGEVQYKKFIGHNLTGNIVFANNNLNISNVSLSHANGRMELNGAIKEESNANTATAKVTLQNVDVKKLFYAFNNFGQDGIAAENIQGNLNTIANISLAFNSSGIAIPGSIKGTLDFSLKNGAIINYEPLQNIKNFILKKKDMSHLYFAELKNRLEVDGYKIKINKMEIQSSAIGMFVDGIYDSKKTDTKINIQVPLKGLKQRDSAYIPQNIGVDAKKGLSVYLEGKNDKTGKVKFSLNATKTIRKIF